jgi:hypothetical protein
MEWTTFDASAVETLRLPGRPSRVTAAGEVLSERTDLDAEGYAVRLLPSGDAVVRVRHEARGPVIVTTGTAEAPADPAETDGPSQTSPQTGGCSVAPGGPR